MYESICQKCVPEVSKPGPVDVSKMTKPCIYIGETSRSIYERAGEHWDAYRNRKPDSHIWKHHLMHHNSEGEPEMIFKVVGTFRSALSRQINEAVRMKNRGTLALNSKGEYNRCKIHRLTVGEEMNQTGWIEQGEQVPDGKIGEKLMMDRRVKMDKKSRRDMDGNVSVTQPRKRNNMGEIGRPSKKRKYVLVGPEWGTQAKKNQGLDCKVDESTTPLIEGNTAAAVWYSKQEL